MPITGSIDDLELVVGVEVVPNPMQQAVILTLDHLKVAAAETPDALSTRVHFLLRPDAAAQIGQALLEAAAASRPRPN